jgi:hypothetical protein
MSRSHRDKNGTREEKNRVGVFDPSPVTCL